MCLLLFAVLISLTPCFQTQGAKRCCQIPGPRPAEDACARLAQMPRPLSCLAAFGKLPQVSSDTFVLLQISELQSCEVTDVIIFKSSCVRGDPAVY